MTKKSSFYFFDMLKCFHQSTILSNSFLPAFIILYHLKIAALSRSKTLFSLHKYGYWTVCFVSYSIKTFMFKTYTILRPNSI